MYQYRLAQMKKQKKDAPPYSGDRDVFVRKMQGDKLWTPLSKVYIELRGITFIFSHYPCQGKISWMMCWFWTESSLVSIHKWPFPTISASIGGIVCAAYSSMPPRNASDFLELVENCTFLDRKLTTAWKSLRSLGTKKEGVVVWGD